MVGWSTATPSSRALLEEFIGGAEDPVLVATSTNWTDNRNH